MGLIAKQTEGGKFELTPKGNHVAVCYRIIDLGTQPRKAYQGKEKDPCGMVMFSWELPNALMADGKPHTVHKTYNVFFGDNSNLRKDLESWCAQGYNDEQSRAGIDLTEYLGMPCLINIAHEERDGKQYANIASIAPVIQGMPVPPAQNVQVLFDLDRFNPEVYEGFSDALKKRIAQSPEFAKAQAKLLSTGQPAPAQAVAVSEPPMDDDIPF